MFSHLAVFGSAKRIDRASRQARTRAITSVVALACLLSVGAHAAGPPLSMAEAVRLAVAQSPQIAQHKAMVAAANEMTVAAGELPDPKLMFMVENMPVDGPNQFLLTRDPMTLLRFGLMQDFPRPEKRRMRTQRAQADARKGAAQIEAARFMVERDVATAWLARWFAEDVERAIAAQIAEAELAVTTATAGYRAGREPQGELLGAQSLVVELKNRGTEAALMTKRARITLARYIGPDAADRPLGNVPDLARLPPEHMQMSILDTHPEIRLAKAEEASAGAAADVARVAKLPDWSVEFSYGYRGPFPGAIAAAHSAGQTNPSYADMVSLQFTIDLPWSPGTRQDREYAAKLKELDAMRAAREEMTRMHSAELQSMIAEWESSRAQAQRIRDDMLPLVLQRREAALAAYRGGTGPLAPVLEARRMELDVRLSIIQQEMAAAKAWAWLTYVVPTTEAL